MRDFYISSLLAEADGRCVAEIPDLPGRWARGETPEEGTREI